MGSFRFKQFSIAQDNCAMKVGTDGVLLGAWAEVCGTEQRILDIGTGSGLIAIMMAQRASAANIVGVEIEPLSAQQAAENMTLSPWCSRLHCECASIQEYSPEEQFDVIVSNPPYFVNSLLSKGAERTTARHTISLPFEDLILCVERLLSPNGTLSVILPPTESQLLHDLTKDRLHLHRKCLVHGKEGGEVKRIMSEYRLTPTPIPIIEELAIRATPPEEYTQEYKTLTAPFYLKF